MRSPGLLLVAHGTRAPEGAQVTAEVAAAVRELVPDLRVEVGFADVREPCPATVLATMRGPVVAVPMFLAAGYHVRVDVPAQIRATGRTDVTLAQTFGPDPLLVSAAAHRLRLAGWRPDDAVVLAVAGSSDPAAAADSTKAARRLGRLLGGPVGLATVAVGGPRIGDEVARLRAAGARRVAVASWLLAPGLFQRRVAECGADVVAEPIGSHPAVAALAVARYEAALTQELAG